eukprot:scpid109219/ scgid22871/ 
MNFFYEDYHAVLQCRVADCHLIRCQPLYLSTRKPSIYNVALNPSGFGSSATSTGSGTLMEGPALQRRVMAQTVLLCCLLRSMSTVSSASLQPTGENCLRMQSRARS